MTLDFSNWTTWAATLAAVLAIAGVVLNNRKLIMCFPLWIVSNAIVCGLHIYAAYGGALGMIPLAVRDAFFFTLAIEGFYRWSHEKTKDTKKTFAGE